jgi:acetoin utilization deacetylase AcuC-like enzyme
MPLVLISSQHFADHQTPPGHPESPERAEVMDVVASKWRESGGEVVAPPAAARDQLLRVHDDAYLRRVEGTSGLAVALDPDTYTSPDTYDIALLAAGAAVDAVSRVMAGSPQRALCLVRPPGHHAERNRAMGFCFFNSIGVAAAHACTLGASRIAIVDYDVHHGNGTQQMFEEDPSVLYVSMHQSPFYPGTGAADEVGVGDGRGFTVNLPLAAGAVDEDYRAVFAAVALPILRQFEPDLLLVSAGFDAHERDPIAGMRLSSQAFAAMTLDLRAVADECCEGRIVAVTEGGYDLAALRESLFGVVGVLGPEATPAACWPPPGAVAPSRGRAAVAAAKRALDGFWKLE